MTPAEVEEYMLLMKKYGVQNLQIKGEGRELTLCGIYEDIQPQVSTPTPSREELLDSLKD